MEACTTRSRLSNSRIWTKAIPATPEAVAQRVAAAPLSTWLTTILGLALGAFFGGLLGAKMVPEKAVWVTSAVGLVLSLWAVYTLYVVFPAVLWVPAGMLISAVLFSYLGGRLVKPSSPAKAAHP